MRLGGFVIHGDSVGTMGPCLESLAAVCDDLVAVDTGSKDGSAALARAHGFNVLRRRWEGYGAARAEAVPALAGCDWIFFLDSDEWLEAPARDAIRRFKAASCDAPYVALTRRDWGGQRGERFLYRAEHHVRLVRSDHARWDRSMIVHEALPPARSVRLDAAIEHLFAPDLGAMRRKLQEYALLWALRAQSEGRRAKRPELQRLAHLFREMILKGALLRGRRLALSLAMTISQYHALKYRRLREVAAGRHAGLVSLLDEGRLEELFRSVREQVLDEVDRRTFAAANSPARPLPRRTRSIP